MNPDLCNFAFLLGGAAFNVLNVRRLLKDGVVMGISPWPMLYFTMWGIFNLWYYWALHQYFSQAAEGLIVTVNAVWLWLYRRYTFSARHAR